MTRQEEIIPSRLRDFKPNLQTRNQKNERGKKTWSRFSFGAKEKKMKKTTHRLQLGVEVLGAVC